MKNILDSTLKILSRIWKGFLDLLFPEKCRCLSCGSEVNGSYLCRDCEAKISYNNGGDRCERCSRPLIAEESYCPSCGGGMRIYFERAVARFVYEGELTKMIHRFKFRRQAYFQNYFAEELKKSLKDLPKADSIVPVPMHKLREKERGYNQCNLLASELSRISGIAVTAVLRKIVNTREQVGLTGEERRNNVRGSFRIEDKSAIKGKTVLVLDDVMTTNSTVNECARLLKLAGAREIYVLALAITRTRGTQYIE